MKTNHTPGPWRLKENGIIDTEIFNHKNIICTVNLDSGARNKLCKANAKLIAAAPDLLETLNNLLLTIPMHSECFRKPEIEAAKAAIKKATE